MSPSESDDGHKRWSDWHCRHFEKYLNEVMQ